MGRVSLRVVRERGQDLIRDEEFALPRMPQRVMHQFMCQHRANFVLSQLRLDRAGEDDMYFVRHVRQSSVEPSWVLRLINRDWEIDRECESDLVGDRVQRW